MKCPLQILIKRQFYNVDHHQSKQKKSPNFCKASIKKNVLPKMWRRCMAYTLQQTQSLGMLKTIKAHGDRTRDENSGR